MQNFFHTLTHRAYTVRFLPLILKKVFVEILHTFNRLFLEPIKPNQITNTSFNFKLSVSPDNGANYYYNGSYEIGTLEVMKNCLKKGDILVDVGASVGFLSIFGRTIVGTTGKVLCFEPSKNRFRDLMKSISINEYENVIANNVALGDEKGEIYLVESGDGGYLSSIPPLFQPIYTTLLKKKHLDIYSSKDHSKKGYSVEQTTLDKYLLENNITKVHFIKIDVEGYEINVLKGAKSILSGKDAPIISVEIGKRNIKTGIFEFLKNINEYEFFRLKHTKKFLSTLKKFHNINNRWSGSDDNIFCLLPHHIKKISKDILD